MDDFDKLMPAVEAFARRIFEAGMMAERRRILAEVDRGAARRQSVRTIGYGEGSATVTDALKMMPVPEHGVTAQEVAEYCRDISEQQVRAALKTLAGNGRAIRLSRGRYRLSLNS